MACTAGMNHQSGVRKSAHHGTGPRVVEMDMSEDYMVNALGTQTQFTECCQHPMN